MRFFACAASALAMTLVAGTALAQTRCAEETRFDPPLRVLRCTDGLVLETEQGSRLQPIDRNGDGRLEGAELGGRAVLVTLPPGRRVQRDGFQILTPHAIASVRGTVYAVDVTGDRTSVFVSQGRVAVARRRAPETSVTLGAGEGVDVDADQGPLEVRRWPQERVRALLERFGR
ncbi:anti- sigma factor [Methylobacterium variabile]|jgi:ferric-dicitrate binding protein FerR (iron transport regulator)|uniref:Anti-sigma factor n=1 Tax=Methylobacterium variabile TaxID=298794 RepID=A0A0J6T357_9HYPH|nr:FecR domain-containing protein [Methylobacterium variabile]KMO40394.1 anti- sigma factor [Methylobacterium variabile]